jgi:large conductance mechanosensitive channel
MGLVKEYKEFISKGNVVDLAVGVVIGGAFGKIVSSFVADIVMPPLGMLLGGVDFKELKYVMKEAVLDGEGAVTQAAVSINHGMFFQNVLDFLIVALAIFFVVKGINNMKKKEAAAPAAPPAPSKEEVLLGEIRDLLKK